MEKLLEDASIKLSVVVSNITSASARDMVTALVGGGRDPVVMADLARNKLRWKMPQLTESLVKRFDDHHPLLIGGMLQRLARVERRWRTAMPRSPRRSRRARTRWNCCRPSPGSR